MELIILGPGEHFVAINNTYKDYRFTYSLDNKWVESVYPHIVWTTKSLINIDMEINKYIDYLNSYDCLFIMYKSNNTFGIMSKAPLDINLAINTQYI